MSTINVDLDTLQRLQDAYDKAVSYGYKSFTFDKSKMLTTYAKYLLEYMRTTLADMDAL